MKAQKTICAIEFGSGSGDEHLIIPPTVISALCNNWIEIAEAVEQRVRLAEKEKLIWALHLWGEGTDEKPFYFQAEVNRSEKGSVPKGIQLLRGDCYHYSATLISRAYYDNIDIFSDGFGAKGVRGKVTTEALAEEIAEYLNQSN